jgi:hypothetical protein
MFDDVEIRWHLPEEVELEPREPVIIQKLATGTSEFVQCGVAPDHVRDMDSIRARLVPALQRLLFLLVARVC